MKFELLQLRSYYITTHLLPATVLYEIITIEVSLENQILCVRLPLVHTAFFSLNISGKGIFFPVHIRRHVYTCVTGSLNNASRVNKL